MYDNHSLNRVKPINLAVFLITSIGVVASITIAIGISDLWNAKQSIHWPSTTGKILDTYVSFGASKTTSSSIYISYEYTVESIVYRNDRVSYSQSLKKHHSAPNLYLDYYKKNASIKVYYDPVSPYKSVLVPGYDATVDEYSTIITGSFMLALIVLAGWIISKRHTTR